MARRNSTAWYLLNYYLVYELAVFGQDLGEEWLVCDDAEARRYPAMQISTELSTFRHRHYRKRRVLQPSSGLIKFVICSR